MEDDNNVWVQNSFGLNINGIKTKLVKDTPQETYNGITIYYQHHKNIEILKKSTYKGSELWLIFGKNIQRHMNYNLIDEGWLITMNYINFTNIWMLLIRSEKTSSTGM